MYVLYSLLRSLFSSISRTQDIVKMRLYDLEMTQNIANKFRRRITFADKGSLSFKDPKTALSK